MLYSVVNVYGILVVYKLFFNVVFELKNVLIIDSLTDGEKTILSTFVLVKLALYVIPVVGASSNSIYTVLSKYIALVAIFVIDELITKAPILLWYKEGIYQILYID